MANKRLEREEEQQAEDARSDAPAQGANAADRPAKEEMIEDDEVVNADEDDLNDLEDEEEEAAEDAETSAL